MIIKRPLSNFFKALLAFLYEYGKDCFYAIIATWVLLYCLAPARFASHYSYIKIEDIPNELDKSYPVRDNSCTINVIEEKKLLYPNEKPELKEEVLAKELGIQPGGQWEPTTCQAQFNVAIILPYRNRETQLAIFTNYIHPFLQKQNLHYQIFVIEQSVDHDFNRAKLFNIGYTEAMKMRSFHCFIFQDIDLIPQNVNNIYACTKMPRHMSSSVNTFRYNLPYTGLFGGAIALTSEQFRMVNGFSNIFFGWGGEDDDFYSRLKTRGLKVWHFFLRHSSTDWKFGC